MGRRCCRAAPDTARYSEDDRIYTWRVGLRAETGN